MCNMRGKTERRGGAWSVQVIADSISVVSTPS